MSSITPTAASPPEIEDGRGLLPGPASGIKRRVGVVAVQTWHPARTGVARGGGTDRRPKKAGVAGAAGAIVTPARIVYR